MDDDTLPGFPYQFKSIEPSEQEQLNKLYDVFIKTSLRVGPCGYLVHECYKKDAANIYNMAIRPTDIFVASYQRSGTTLTQELVWLIANNLDYSKAKEVPLTNRYKFLDNFINYEEKFVDVYAKRIKQNEPNTDEEKLKQLLIEWSKPISGQLALMPSPRFIKTHIPLSLLNPKLLDTGKVVYVARDPRDVAVSCYHHAVLFKVMQFPNGFRDFWNIFYKNLFLFLPYFDHVKEAWDKRHHPNMLFIFYEELIQDLPSVIRRVAVFLNKELKPEQINPLIDHLKIDNFKQNPSLNFEQSRQHGLLASGETFIRRGKAGGWRDYFDEEMTQQAEQWMADNLRDTDLRFPSL